MTVYFVTREFCFINDKDELMYSTSVFLPI